MKSIGITNTSKASSFIALILLLLSGAAGVLAVAPAATAASGPTLTVSPNSGTPALANQWYGTYKPATNITVTGTGFPSGQAEITVGLVSTSTTVTPTTVLQYQLCLLDESIAPAAPAPTVCGSEPAYLGLGTGDTGNYYVTADANGYFQVVFQVPFVEGAPADYYNVAATYSTSSGYVLSNSVPFTVTPAAAIITEATGASSGTYNSRVEVFAAGFGANETIDILPSQNFLVSTPWGNPIGKAFSFFEVGALGATASEGVSTLATGFAAGELPCGALATVTDGLPPYASTATSSIETWGLFGAEGGLTCDAAYVSDHPQGTVSVSLIGATSGNTATTTYTVTPSIQVQSSPFAITTFVLPSTSGSAYLVGHDFPKSASIPSNSLMLAGVTTIQSSTTTTSEGAFGPIPFTYTSSLPAGLITATFDGATYSFANGNFEASPVLQQLEDSDQLLPAGVLIAATTSISFIQLDMPSHSVGDVAYVFGSCVDTSATCESHVTPSTAPTAAFAGTYTTSLTGPPVESTTYKLATATTLATDFIQVSAAGATATGVGEFQSVLVSGPTYYDGYWEAFLVPNSYGGSSTSTITLTSEDTPPATSLTIKPSEDSFGFPSSVVTGIRDISPVDNTGNTFTMDVSGFNTTDVAANVYLGSSFWFECPTAATPGITTYVAPGAFNCLIPAAKTIPDVASGPYTVWINGTAVGNYATDSWVMYPVDEAVSLSTQLNVKPGTIVGLLTASPGGVHGLAAKTKYTVEFSGMNATTFTSTSSGQVPPGVQFAVPSGTSGYHLVDIVTSSGESAFFVNQLSTLGQFANLFITTSNSLTATPSSGNVGGTVGISGSGLAANYLYYVWVPLVIGTFAPVASYTSFTTDASGNIPSGVSITYPEMATGAGPGAGCGGSAYATPAVELGTSATIYVAVKSSDITAVPPSEPIGQATFFLEGQFILSSATASAGSLVSIAATGLCTNTNYQMVFNYQVASTGTAYTGTVVGSFASDGSGDATGTFTVPPGTPAGTYTMQLARAGNDLGILSTPPYLTVGAAPTVGLTTSTLVPSGSASEGTVNGQATVSQAYTNTGTASLSVYEWVSAMNSAGQTVGVFLGSGTIGAGQTVTLGAALFNLPPGTYTATVFVTTTSGIVISKTTTTASFSV